MDMHKFQTIHFFLEMLEILLISNIIVVYIWILDDVFSYPIELILSFHKNFYGNLILSWCHTKWHRRHLLLCINITYNTNKKDYVIL